MNESLVAIWVVPNRDKHRTYAPPNKSISIHSSRQGGNTRKLSEVVGQRYYPFKDDRERERDEAARRIRCIAFFDYCRPLALTGCLLTGQPQPCGRTFWVCFSRPWITSASEDFFWILLLRTRALHSIVQQQPHPPVLV
jgi:hypothetical protein